MRRKLALSAVLVAATTSTAAADPAAEGERVRTEVHQLFTAFAKKDAGRVLAMLADTVEVYGLAFTDKKCAKAFAGEATVRGKARKKLAACLVKAPGLPSATTEFEVTEYADDWQVDFQDGAGLMLVRFGRDVDPPRIDEVFGSDLQAEGVAGVWRGQVGGVVITRDDLAAPATAAPAGTPAPAPPPPKPVSPTAVEAQRLTGNMIIPPDEATAKEIAKSSKTKLVAAYKMCLSTAGAVSTVTQLKASGFPGWDRLIERGMKTWTYKPFVDDTGAAIPVCTAVTFIYSVP